jgi:hypothetical protein
MLASGTGVAAASGFLTVGLELVYMRLDAA